MKQGSGRSLATGQKREPIVHKVNPSGVANLGNMVGNRRAVEPIESGRGFTAPAPKAETVHKKGSQGRY